MAKVKDKKTAANIVPQGLLDEDPPMDESETVEALSALVDGKKAEVLGTEKPVPLVEDTQEMKVEHGQLKPWDRKVMALEEQHTTPADLYHRGVQKFEIVNEETAKAIVLEYLNKDQWESGASIGVPWEFWTPVTLEFCERYGINVVSRKTNEAGHILGGQDTKLGWAPRDVIERWRELQRTRGQSENYQKQKAINDQLGEMGIGAGRQMLQDPASGDAVFAQQAEGFRQLYQKDPETGRPKVLDMDVPPDG
jgi:hypothetical protein